MVLDRRCAVLFLAALAAANPARASLCNTDIWGGRTADIRPTGDRAVQIQAQTNLIHLGLQSAHPFCHGDFFAKVQLVGIGPSCVSIDRSEHHNTLGEGTMSLVQRTCSGLSYNNHYYAGGTHWGFGEGEYFSLSPNSAYFTEPAADNDGDGWTADVDCDDADDTTYPGAVIPPCENLDPYVYVDHDCDGEDDRNQCSSPILLDMAGDGFNLTNVDDGVLFDLNADGVRERVAWTAPGTDDAWLVLDRDGNGTIDNGWELFGNWTPQPSTATWNGFLALAVFDAPQAGGNGDGRIDAEDAIYSELSLWRDVNHDGLSQRDELVRLVEAGVNRIGLDYQRSLRRDRWGNVFLFRATVDGVGSPWAYDVFLAAAPRR